MVKGHLRAQGPQLLVYFRDETVIDNSQLPVERFSAVTPKGIDSTLKIQSAKQGDSATFLCASSLATAVKGHILAVLKADGFLQATFQ